MTHKFFSVETCNGGSYNIELSSFGNSFFSKEVTDAISQFVDVVNIDLTRAQEEESASLRTLSIITNRIAEFFLEHRNLVICYYCDFLGPIPHTNKKMTCQAYRNQLFSLLFKRYIGKFNVTGVIDKVITIHGAEDYFVHIIYRQTHEKHVQLLANSIHYGYDKP